jgi:hypothetical protein
MLTPSLSARDRTRTTCAATLRESVLSEMPTPVPAEAADAEPCLSYPPASLSTRVHVISVEEAGGLFGLGRSASYEAARRGELPTLRFGRRLVVPIPRIEAMLGGTLPQVEEQ